MQDKTRKPAQVLHFFGVRPGMTVVDVFAGGGYYTELLSYAVGPKGHVIAHNNKAYLTYQEKTIKKRFTANRLPNVTSVIAEANELVLAANSADIVFLALAYHDIYYRPKSSEWPPIDRDDFLSRIYSFLKPGGILAIIDHRAEPGSPTSTGHTLHRIDPIIVIKELSNLGFKLVASADFLENPDDDLSQHMYAQKIRGKTSRFILKFTKPLEFNKPFMPDEPWPIW